MHMPLTPRTRKALTHNPFLMLGLLALIAIGMAALCLVVLNSIGLFVLDELRMLVLALAGVAGAILMFVADLVLYYSKVPSERTARVYFASIDPNGERLAESPMADIAPERLMLGGGLLRFRRDPSIERAGTPGHPRFSGHVRGGSSR